MLNLAELRKRRDAGEDGFTLIELLVVVVIIGILIAIAIPVYLNYQKGANDKAAQSDLRSAVSVLEQCNSDNGAYPTAVSTTGVITGCTGQTIKVSNGTTFKYTLTAGPPQSYMMTSGNSNGSTGKVFCYNSKNGGSVTNVKTGTLTVAGATC